VLILAEKGPGYILGDYFKNSSGHPDREWKCQSSALK
jgi:hypothetical protein